jgi:hypothetical protein
MVLFENCVFVRYCFSRWMCVVFLRLWEKEVVRELVGCQGAAANV